MIIKTSYPFMKPPPSARLIRGHRLAQGIVDLWLLNEGSGTTFFDLSGNGKVGTLYGETSWVAGDYGAALYFDGSGNDYTSSGLHPGISYANPFTAIIHAKNTTAEVLKGFFNIQSTQDDAGQICSAYYSSTYNGILFSRKNVTAYSAKPAAAITQTDWHDFAVTCPGGDVVLTLYVDGQLSTTNGVAQLSNIGTLNVVTLGRGLPTYYADCSVGYVMIYDRVLSASEIALLYTKPFCMFERKARTALLSGYAVPPVGAAAIMTTNAGIWGPTY